MYLARLHKLLEIFSLCVYVSNAHKLHCDVLIHLSVLKARACYLVRDCVL